MYARSFLDISNPGNEVLLNDQIGSSDYENEDNSLPVLSDGNMIVTYSGIHSTLDPDGGILSRIIDKFG